MLRIYAYVDGFDLQEVEGLLLDKLQGFSETWGVDSVQVINHKCPRTPDLEPEDFPDWNLGINVEVENLARTKVEALVKFLSEAAIESGREFVVGTYFPEKHITEDLCFIGAAVTQESIDFLTEQLQ